MKILGIDPSSINRSTYGAICCMNKGKVEKIIRLDQSIRKIYRQLQSWVNGEPTYAYIEYVWAMRGQQAMGAFRFGHGDGVMEMMLVALDIPYERVHPQKWMRYYKMKKKKGEAQTKWKGRLCDVAKKLHKGRFTKMCCDSVLIAYYGTRMRIKR